MPARPPSLPLGSGRGGALVRSPGGALVPSPRGIPAAAGGLLGSAGRLLGNVGLALELPGVAQRAYEGAIGLRESVEGLLSGDIAGTNRRTRTPGYQPVSQRGAASSGGQYAGPGFMPDAAVFPRGRGQVGGGNAGASRASQWAPAATPRPSGGGGAVGGGSRSAPAGSALPLGGGNPPGFGPTVTGSTRAQNQASERLRMEQQYAKPQYWSTDAGKGMLDLAANQRAPMEAKLSDYYGAQRAVGIGAKEQIAEAVSGGRADLKAWAIAHPDLAYREYLKRNPEQASQLLRPDDNPRLMTAPMKTDPTEVFSGRIGGGSQLAGTAVSDAPAWPGNGMSDDQLRAAYSGAMDFRPNAPVDLARAQLSGAPLDAMTGRIGSGELLAGSQAPSPVAFPGAALSEERIAAAYRPGSPAIAVQPMSAPSWDSADPYTGKIAVNYQPQGAPSGGMLGTGAAPASTIGDTSMGEVYSIQDETLKRALANAAAFNRQKLGWQ